MPFPMASKYLAAHKATCNQTQTVYILVSAKPKLAPPGQKAGKGYIYPQQVSRISKSIKNDDVIQGAPTLTQGRDTPEYSMLGCKQYIPKYMQLKVIIREGKISDMF